MKNLTNILQMINFLTKTLNIINKPYFNKNTKISIYLIILNIIYYSLLNNINMLIIYNIEKELEKIVSILNEIDIDDDEIFELKLYFYINMKNEKLIREFINIIKKYKIDNNKIYILIQIKKIKRFILKNNLWTNSLGISVIF